jgi:hypothetical protein
MGILKAPWSLQHLRSQHPFGRKAGRDTIAAGTPVVAIMIAGIETMTLPGGDITDISTGIVIAHAGRTTPTSTTTHRPLTGMSRRRRACTS